VDAVTKKVLIFGLGAFAEVAHAYLTEDSPHEVSAFTAHEAFLTERSFRGLEVVPFEAVERTHPPDRFRIFVAVGFKRVNRARAEVYEACKRKGYEFVSHVHSRASRSAEATVGENCFVLENCVLQPGVRVGNNVVIWAGSVVCHHARIDDHCFLASGVTVSGGVNVGAYTFVGANATLRDGITVGAHCVIGAGAVILRDAKEKGVYAVKSTERSSVPSDELRGI
jgi:sugar O-acyltransferase (sialic acid O-acetyltransferase NeuD family)